MAEVFEPNAQQPIGRKKPPSYRHVDLFPLTASTEPTKPVPVVLGIDWYTAFDRPVLRNGLWWLPDVSKGESFGTYRGGHAIAAKPDSMSDLATWRDYYHQGSPQHPGTIGGCVGQSGSRMKTWLERAKFDPRWLYHETQKRDWWNGGEYPGAPEYMEGTSVSVMMDVLRTIGHKTPAGAAPKPAFGIAANRWANSIDDVRAALKSPRHDDLEAIPLVNSWGRYGWPHVAYLPYATWTALVPNAGGETAIPTDR
jgi:hypothetical protein